MQSQHFYSLFVFYQELDGVECLQNSAHLEILNVFLSVTNWLYIILVEQTHYISTFSCRLDNTVEKRFPAVS